MQESTTREKVLKKIRNALIHKTPNPYPSLDLDSPVFTSTDDPLEVIFAERFTEAGGHLIFCENKLEVIEGLLVLSEQRGWKNIYCNEEAISAFLKEYEFPHTTLLDTDTPEVAVTSCESLIARSGSIVLSVAQVKNRKFPYHARVHIVFANVNQLAQDIREIITLLKVKYNNKLPSSTTIITGPSRTADIENNTIIGVHGPGELYLFLLDDQNENR